MRNFSCNSSVGSGSQTYANRLRRKPASPEFRDCVDKLISPLTPRAVQSLRPDPEDSLDRKFQDLERRVESFEASVKRQIELVDRERIALHEERSHREILKGPLKGVFEHANVLIRFLRPPQPSASSTPVKGGSEQERDVNRDSVSVNKSDNVDMSDDVNKSGSVHGDDDNTSVGGGERE